MKTYKLYLILFVLFTFAITNAREYYFRFQISEKAELRQLTRIVSIDNVKGDTVYAYANQREWNEFQALDYHYEILPHPGTLIQPRMAKNLNELRDWDSYPTYQQYLSLMYQFEANFPELCDIQTIGYSVEGKKLLFAKISNHVNIDENEPEVMYTSSMHGDETTGYVLMLRLIDYLLTQYGFDPYITFLVNNLEIWINPLANPDGTYHLSDTTVYSATRGNANGVDLNRNFPDPDEGPHPFGYPWQPETIAMVEFADAHRFIISANFHGGAEVVNYPWDTWPRRHPDDTWYQTTCRQYADTAQYYAASYNPPNYNYMNDLNNGITNGWDWYPIAGGRQDFMNYWHGCREVTIELSSTKLLPSSQLPAHWYYNKASLLQYLENSLYGIRGKVMDITSNTPLDATVFTLNHDQDGSQVYTDPAVGDYHRMIAPGSYDLQFTVPGFASRTIPNVNVTNGGIHYLDVQLTPDSTGTVWGLALLTDTTDYSGIQVGAGNRTTYTNQSGFFTLTALPAGPVQIRLEKAGYKPVVIDTTLLSQDSLWLETGLKPVTSSVLLINDDGGMRNGSIPGVGKTISRWRNNLSRGASASLVEQSLKSAGYAVRRENSWSTFPLTWTNYDLLFWSSGASANPIENPDMVNALINFVNSGGILIIEGGEIGYAYENTNFASTVLHIQDWQYDGAGNLVVQNATHPVTAGLPGTILLNYQGISSNQDAVLPAPGADLLIGNSNAPATAGVISEDSVIYMAFNAAVAEQGPVQRLIRNAAHYLHPVAHPQKDLAVTGLQNTNRGKMIPADTLLPLSLTLKNYGLLALEPGIPVELRIESGEHSINFQAATPDTIHPDETTELYMGEWMVPDTLSEWMVKGWTILGGDEVPSNDSLSFRVISLPTSTIFTDNFETGLSNWTVVPGDTGHAENSWFAASWPVAGGRYAARVLPAANTSQNEWLISPGITDPGKVSFYWDYGADQITNNRLLVLASTNDSLPSSFTDTLLVLENGQSYPANHFAGMQSVNLSAYQNQTIYLAFVYTGFQGYYWSVDNLIVTEWQETAIEDNPQVAAKFSLYQNYPNPFNPITTIRYQLAWRAKIVVEVFNILGQKVAIREKGIQSPGIHHIKWDASDYASGIYFYRFTALDPSGEKKLYQKTLEMVLLR